jgi:hypothetical protein
MPHFRGVLGSMTPQRHPVESFALNAGEALFPGVAKAGRRNQYGNSDKGVSSVSLACAAPLFHRWRVIVTVLIAYSPYRCQEDGSMNHVHAYATFAEVKLVHHVVILPVNCNS